jgi:hypothetical protein
VHRQAENRAGNRDLTVFIHRSHLQMWLMPPQDTIYCISYAFMHYPALPFQHLYGDVKGGRRFALSHGLLATPPSSFFIAEGDRLNTAHQIAQDWVFN